MKHVVDYFFTPSSPWTYLGHRRFMEIAERNDVAINVKPMDLSSKVFPVSGGLPVAERPKQRLSYRLIELRRWSAYLGMPLNLTPAVFPVATDLAARMIVAADMMRGSQCALEFAARVLAGVWTENRNIAAEETLVEIAEAAGLEGDAAVSVASEVTVRERYAGYTQEAIERQVFGAPSYIFRDEPFWGQDRLEFLERSLVSARP